MGAFLFMTMHKEENNMQKQEKPLIGLLIDDNEKEELHRICLKYNIPILYEEPFRDGKSHYLWAFNDDGIGLTGTYIMQRLNKIIHGTKELVEYLETK